MRLNGLRQNSPQFFLLLLLKHSGGTVQESAGLQDTELIKSALT
jgi:hypothetical protein